MNLLKQIDEAIEKVLDQLINPPLFIPKNKEVIVKGNITIYDQPERIILLDKLMTTRYYLLQQGNFNHD